MITSEDVLDWLEEQKIIHNDYVRYTILRDYEYANDGYIRLLKWLEENNAATPENCRVSDCWMLTEAAHKGDIWVLEWLRKHGAATVDDCRAQGCDAFYKALYNMRLPVLEWLHAQNAVTLNDYSACAFGLPYSIATSNGTYMLGWLEKRGLTTPAHFRTNIALKCAAENGNIFALEWLKARGAVDPRYYKDAGCLRAAAEKGCLCVLNWLKVHDLLEAELCCKEFSSEALRRAANNGHIKALEWLEAQGVATLENCREWECYILIKAAEKGNISVLNWLDKLGAATPADCCARNSDALRSAIINGHVAVAEWLLAHKAELPVDWQRDEIIPRVARNNHLKMLKWLAEKKCVVADYCDGKYSGVLRAAAHSGNIEILNWLNEIRPITRDNYRKQSPLQEAAAGGHIHVMQWFHERGFLARDSQEDESVIEDTVDFAVVNGKTDVIEWLYKQGVMTQKDCKFKETAVAIRAARDGHLSVLKCLHRYGMLAPADFDNDEMKSLAFYGHLEILDWLTKERLFSPASGAGVAVFSSAIWHKRRRILKWFAEYVDLHWFDSGFTKSFTKIWWDVWHKKQLLIILAGKRRGLRLPAELWDFLNRFC
jgi:hypothetical protein